MAYARIEEGPWPLGMFGLGATAPSGGEGIPEGGVAALEDGIWTDDAMPEQRGGSSYATDTEFGAGGLDWIWTGRLIAGERIAFVDVTNRNVGAIDPAGSDTPTTIYSTTDAGVPVTTAQIGGVVYIGLEAGVLAWGGSLKAAYSTGTASFTAGSATITGAGTTWTGNVEPGMFMERTGFDGWGVVEEVVSNTEVRLTEPWAGATAAGVAYLSRPVVPHLGTLFGATTGVAAVGGRLLVAVGNRVLFSPINDPLGTYNTTENHHEFPASVLGLASLRDTAIVFTVAGTYAIYNIALDLTDDNGDPLHRVELVSRELVLSGQAGVASWRGALIVPALDGVWLMEGVGQPQKISTPVDAEMLDSPNHWAAGNPGQAAVYRGHYLLPIRTAGGGLLRVWVCRLDPNRFGRTFLWSYFTASGGGGQAVATTGVTLYGGDSDGRVRALSWFDRDGDSEEADGSFAQMELRTRGIPTGNDVANYVASVAMRYTLEDPASTNPTASAAYRLDSGNATSSVALTGTAAETSSSLHQFDEYTWAVGRSATTFQVHVTGPSARSMSFKIRQLALKVRPSAKV